MPRVDSAAEGEPVRPAAGPARGGNWRRIAPLDLAAFPAPLIPGNRGPLWRIAWYLVGALFFASPILGLLPSRAKAALLRLFGAKVGRGLVCKPRVTIKYPWFLEIGDHVWLGERSWIDNHCQVTIGANCCISQGAYIFTGNHDWMDSAFAFFCAPVTIGEGVWVTAFQRVGPGSVIPPHSLVSGAAGAGSGGD